MGSECIGKNGSDVAKILFEAIDLHRSVIVEKLRRSMGSLAGSAAAADPYSARLGMK